MACFVCDAFWLCVVLLFVTCGCKAVVDEAVTCPEVRPLLYGDMVASKPPPYEAGATLTFNCDRGFKGKGKGQITCKRNGRWSGPVPFCQAFRCERDESKIQKGRKCRKPCKSDADCRGTFKRCLCDDWCGKSCYNPEADCPELTDPPNGYIILEELAYGHTATYGCNAGYTLTGEATRTCRSDRKWSGHEPHCIAFSYCGLSGQLDETLFSGKVIDGTDAKLGAWPWQVLLFHNNEYSARQIYNRESGFGGGSIVNNEWILTAAHVFEIFPGFLKKKDWKDKFLIALGIHEFLEFGEAVPSHVHIYEPEKLIRHSNFSSVYYDYDVALIRVGKRLKKDGDLFVADNDATSGIISFSRYIRPVCLPCIKGGPLTPVDIWKNFDRQACPLEEDKPKLGRVKRPQTVAPGEQVVVTGFGKKTDPGDDYEYTPNKLQEGLLKIVKDHSCIESVKKIQNLFLHARYTDRMLCAGSINDSVKVDSCQGDSGGPLVKQHSATYGFEYDYWTQVGIVSWGWGCGNEYPGYYTSVASIMGWVWTVLDDSRIGVWSRWFPWSRCTKTCGSGTQLRTRACVGKNCPGPARETRKCNEIRCPGGPQCPPVHVPAHGSIEVTPFPNMFHVGTKVTFKCGQGRLFIGGPPSIICMDNATWSESRRPVCEDEWTAWSVWSTCTASCNGVKWKARKCRRASDIVSSLLSCKGDSIKYTECNTDACPSSGSDNTECKGGSLLCVKNNLNIGSAETLGSHLSKLLGILGG